MTDKIRDFIYTETYNTYNNTCFSSEDIKSFIEEYEAELEIALNCYYDYNDEEVDFETTERAWGMYNTVQVHNYPIISALKTILRERGEN